MESDLNIKQVDQINKDTSLNASATNKTTENKILTRSKHGTFPLWNSKHGLLQKGWQGIPRRGHHGLCWDTVYVSQTEEETQYVQTDIGESHAPSIPNLNHGEEREETKDDMTRILILV